VALVGIEAVVISALLVSTTCSNKRTILPNEAMPPHLPEEEAETDNQILETPPLPRHRTVHLQARDQPRTIASVIALPEVVTCSMMPAPTTVIQAAEIGTVIRTASASVVVKTALTVAVTDVKTAVTVTLIASAVAEAM
jgi:hypothetical protein